MFSCEFCEFSKNTFSYKTPPLAASVNCLVFRCVYSFFLKWWNSIKICVNFFFSQIRLGFKSYREWKIQIPNNKGFTQKQPPRGVLRKRCSENMQQICKRIPMPKMIYLFKVNSRNTRRRCEICSKLTIKITERRHWHRWGVVTFNFNMFSFLWWIMCQMCSKLTINHLRK